MAVSQWTQCTDKSVKTRCGHAHTHCRCSGLSDLEPWNSECHHCEFSKIYLESRDEQGYIRDMALCLQRILIPPHLIMSITSDFQNNRTIAAHQRLLSQTFVVPSQLDVNSLGEHHVLVDHDHLSPVCTISGLFISLYFFTWLPHFAAMIMTSATGGPRLTRNANVGLISCFPSQQLFLFVLVLSQKEVVMHLYAGGKNRKKRCSKATTVVQNHVGGDTDETEPFNHIQPNPNLKKSLWDSLQVII